MTAPLLTATRQNGKLASAGTGFLVGVALLIALGVFADQVAPRLLFVGLAVGFGLAVATALYAVYAVRCPNCNLAWVRWSLGHQSHSQWLHWLYGFTVCPGCGATATGGRLQPNSTPHSDARDMPPSAKSAGARAGGRER